MAIPDLETQITTAYRPTLRDMVMLEMPVGVKISPNGRRLAALVRTTNWRDNRYENHCFIHDLDTGTAYPLNCTGSVNQVEWLDTDTLALTKNGTDKESKSQIWLYEGLIGEGWAVTDHETGIEFFKPFAGGFLFLARHPERHENKKRADRFGKFIHFEQEASSSALYYVDLAEQRRYRTQARSMTEDEAKELISPVIELSRLFPEPVAIQGFVPSPAGDAVYLNCREGEDMVYLRETQIFCIQLDVDAALAESMQRQRTRRAEGHEDVTDDKVTAYLGQLTQIPLPRDTRILAISPDGGHLLLTYKARDAMMYTQENLGWLAVAKALSADSIASCLEHVRNLTLDLDREIMDAIWVANGIYGTYADGTVARLLYIDGDGELNTLDLDGIYPAFSFDVADTGQLALIGASAERCTEAYVTDPPAPGHSRQLQQLTNFAQAISDWRLGTIETVRWQSKDGTEIEGVLHKPPDFDPHRQYPLVFVVHGGPAWFSTNYMLAFEDRAYYPTIQFLNEDILVLKPNYRGSIGYGQSFMELNVDNLGVGDLWDLESAIDHLVAQGWVDPDRVGCMGWSQGGYISAFAGLHSDKFKAVSVGAGISDWYTYHISNDIPDFTVDYLSGSPFRDRERYFKTAPISNLANAQTPMLIQHGAEDRRVPLSNATELYRGLREMGIPVELFVYPEMGHPITKPRENHAVLHQNLTWFNHYLLDDDLNLE